MLWLHKKQKLETNIEKIQNKLVNKLVNNISCDLSLRLYEDGGIINADWLNCYSTSSTSIEYMYVEINQ